MLERERRLPSDDELRKIHEAPPGPEPSKHHPNRLVNLTDAVEAKMAAYRKELQVEFEAGRIDKREQIRREVLYDQKLARAIDSNLEGKTVVLPEPDRARTSEQRKHQAELSENRERPTPFVKKTIDYERALQDPQYRREIVKQMKAERQFQLEQQGRNDGPQRPRQDGRGG